MRRGSFHERKKGPRAGAGAPLWALHPEASPERGEQPTALAEKCEVRAPEESQAPDTPHLAPFMPWQEEMVFYYYSNHGVPVGRFKSRAQWQGDISRCDGSIRLHDLRVSDSGTYECELRLLQNSSIFKSQTELLVIPPAPTEAGGAATEDVAPSPTDSGFWPAVVGCGCVAVVVAFLAGLCVRKRFATISALERMGKSSSKSKAEEAIYCSIPGAEIPKAEQEAKKKRRAEDTYITMHPSHCRDNGVYVELAKRTIPSEWMAEGTQGDGQSQEPHSRPEEAPPQPPEQQK